MICLDCVAHFHTVAQSEERVASMSRPPWDEMSDTELLVQLPLILQSADQNLRFAREWVDLIRSRKISWAAIGNALGVSRQSAWERFGGGKDPDRGCRGRGQLSVGAASRAAERVEARDLVVEGREQQVGHLEGGAAAERRAGSPACARSRTGCPPWPGGTSRRRAGRRRRSSRPPLISASRRT